MLRISALFFLSLCTLSAFACSGGDKIATVEGEGGDGHSHPVLPEGGAGGLGGAPSGDGACEATGLCGLLECDTGELEGNHVAECAELRFETNPPTSGEHYPVWAQFGIYETEVPRGYWLHTIEHSGVALLYNCDEAAKVNLDCEALKGELVDFYDAFPNDPLCNDVRHRLFIAPDSKLDVPFAAVAWGYYLKGTCFDPTAVSAFVEKHYGMNYENLCLSGVAPTSCK